MELLGAVLAIIAVTLIVRSLLRHEIVFEYQRGLLYRDGKLIEVLPPGGRWVTPLLHRIDRVDVRLQTTVVTGQEVLTADHLGIKLSVAASYRVVDPRTAITATASYSEALHQEIQLLVRELVANRTLAELLAARAALNTELDQALRPRLGPLGLELDAVGVRDIMLPGRLREVYMQVAQAERAGEAALVRARAEVAANRALANAARQLHEQPGLAILRSLQAVEEAARTPGASVVFGVPPTGLSPAAEPPAAAARRSTRKKASSRPAD